VVEGLPKRHKQSAAQVNVSDGGPWHVAGGLGNRHCATGGPMGLPLASAACFFSGIPTRGLT
jgi:hypothetical protein